MASLLRESLQLLQCEHTTDYLYLCCILQEMPLGIVGWRSKISYVSSATVFCSAPDSPSPGRSALRTRARSVSTWQNTELYLAFQTFGLSTPASPVPENFRRRNRQTKCAWAV